MHIKNNRKRNRKKSSLRLTNIWNSCKEIWLMKTSNHKSISLCAGENLIMISGFNPISRTYKPSNKKLKFGLPYALEWQLI